jgi:hypothetical protein
MWDPNNEVMCTCQLSLNTTVTTVLNSQPTTQVKNSFHHEPNSFLKLYYILVPKVYMSLRLRNEKNSNPIKSPQDISKKQIVWYIGTPCCQRNNYVSILFKCSSRKKTFCFKQICIFCKLERIFFFSDCWQTLMQYCLHFYYFLFTQSCDKNVD